MNAYPYDPPGKGGEPVSPVNYPMPAKPSPVPNYPWPKK